MQIDLILLVGLAALAVMLVNLYQALRLKAQISGGMIGKRWNTMVLLVLLFAVGYAILPFLGVLDAHAQ